MAYSSGPYSLFANLPSPPKAILTSSRLIDFVTKKYVTTDAGGFVAMDDVAQRVALLISFSFKASKFISATADNANRDSIKKSLTLLTGGPEPSIRLISVDIGSDAPGVSKMSVTYHNLLTDTEQTITPVI